MDLFPLLLVQQLLQRKFDTFLSIHLFSVHVYDVQLMYYRNGSIIANMFNHNHTKDYNLTISKKFHSTNRIHQFIPNYVLIFILCIDRTSPLQSCFSSIQYLIINHYCLSMISLPLYLVCFLALSLLLSFILNIFIYKVIF